MLTEKQALEVAANMAEQAIRAMERNQRNGVYGQFVKKEL